VSQVETRHSLLIAEFATKRLCAEEQEARDAIRLAVSALNTKGRGL